ncbi:MAG: hypothetical protein ACI3W5_11090 [Faecousia sp.]
MAHRRVDVGADAHIGPQNAIQYFYGTAALLATLEWADVGIGPQNAIQYFYGTAALLATLEWADVGIGPYGISRFVTIETGN